jgi:hypothetical protein
VQSWRWAIGLVVAALALGCDSAKSYPFQGDWQAVGVLGLFDIRVTQTGQHVAGAMTYASYQVGDTTATSFGTISGTDANGGVTFALLFGAGWGTNGVNINPTFTGHFTDASTIVGTVSSGGAMRLTRITL